MTVLIFVSPKHIMSLKINKHCLDSPDFDKFAAVIGRPSPDFCPMQLCFVSRAICATEAWVLQAGIRWTFCLFFVRSVQDSASQGEPQKMNEHFLSHST